MRVVPTAIAALLLMAAVSGGCDAVNPNPTPISRCWIGLHAEYRLTAADGAEPVEAAIQDAGRIINDRLLRMGLAAFEVRTRADGVIEVDLQAVPDPAEVSSLITASGQLEFVSVPRGKFAQAGEQMPPGGLRILGREEVESVVRGADQIGRPALDVILTQRGADLFDAFAAANLAQQVAIVSDSIVLSAPIIQAPTFDGRIQLTGDTIADQIERILTLFQQPPLPGLLEELVMAPVQPPPGC